MSRSIIDVANKLGVVGSPTTDMIKEFEKFYDQCVVTAGVLDNDEVGMNYYVIQSELNPTYGATIYPKNIHGGGAGWNMHTTAGKKLLAPNEVADLAGKAVVEELLAECSRLHELTDH